MKLDAGQLDTHLQGELAPVYILSGDETLLVQEAADAIRQAAQQKGFTERQVMHVDRSFDWNALNDAANALSLFAEQRLIELRLPTGKPGDAGRKALQAWAEQPPQDTVLLIITGKLEASVSKTKWHKAMDKLGKNIVIWPLDSNRLVSWISARMRAKGLQPEAAAVELLSQRIEGNLMAAAQEIEKLVLLHGEGPITLDDIDDAVTDSARFDIYRLVDTALSGDVAYTQRMLNRLRDEGVEAVLVLWVLSREIRSLAKMAGESASPAGRPDAAKLDQVLTQYRVWQKRKPLIKNVLMKYGPRRWQGLLIAAARIDRLIKGQSTGNVWDELLQLCLALAGLKTAMVLQRDTARSQAI